MARPVRCRRIDGYPEYWTFAPEEDAKETLVVLALDELETIRLIDVEGLNQSQCAKEMDIARTTVTAIYESARKKIADAIINGKRLEISGGHYRLKENQKETMQNLPKKGQETMRVAVTYDNQQIFQHFGHTQQFKIFDIEDGEIKNSEIIDANGAGHGALAGILGAGKVDVLICGGIGGGAIRALNEAGITLCAGVSGSVDEAAKAYADGSLQFTTEANCNHHGHGEHNCGHHREGEHNCGHHGDHQCGHHGDGGSCH